MYSVFQQKEMDKIYEKYLLRIIQKIKERYHSLGLVSSGEFERSLKHLIQNNKLSIIGAKHTYFMEEGRKPGRFPPIADIQKWIEIKPGLPAIFKEKPKQFAYIIARKIAKEGINPSKSNRGRVASLIIDDFLEEELDKMLKEIGLTIADRIQTDLVQVFRIAS